MQIQSVRRIGDTWPERASCLSQGAQDLRYRRPLAVHEKAHAEDLGPSPQGSNDAQDEQDQADGNLVKRYFGHAQSLQHHHRRGQGHVAQHLGQERVGIGPKKAADQKALRTNCIMNTIKAILTFGSLNPTRHTRKADIPISINSIVQTGANNQFGGVKDGFSRVVYHVGMEALVKIDPIKPINRHTPIHITNLIISIALMCSISHTLRIYIPET